MRFEGLDLNLLVALNALLAERNQTIAARKINLSQPAMSAALARLREYFHDDILILQGRQLMPTPLGEALEAPTREALQHIKRTLTARDAFDPATAAKRFRIVLSDFMAIVFLTRVIDKVSAIAPHITFEFLQFGDQPDELLKRGEIDFLIFPDLYLLDLYPRTSLFDEHLVCVACRSNKAVRTSITLEQYRTMGHVAAQFGQSRHPGIEESMLFQHGLKRNIEVSVQNFSAIPHLVVGTRRIATMHSRLARYYARILPLRIVPLPLPLPSFTEALQWPPLHHKDPASIWMREMICAEAAAFHDEAPDPANRPEEIARKGSPKTGISRARK